MIKSHELEDYDIAADSHNWQFTLKTLVSHAHAYDLEYIFLVPETVNISNPGSIHGAIKWTNVFVNWLGVSLACCKE